MSLERPDTVAKRMFYIGLFGLPWLWAVNIMYFWDSVYGRLPCFGKSLSDSDDNEHVNAEDAGILGLMEGSRSQDDGDDHPNGTATFGDFCYMLRHFNFFFVYLLSALFYSSCLINDHLYTEIEVNSETAPSPEIIKAEVAKWVKRSTIGSIVSTCLFIAWVITFQLNKDSFGPNWFVMTQDAADLTGW
jgi:hypothetical protein